MSGERCGQVEHRGVRADGGAARAAGPEPRRAPREGLRRVRPGPQRAAPQLPPGRLRAPAGPRPLPGQQHRRRLRPGSPRLVPARHRAPFTRRGRRSWLLRTPPVSPLRSSVSKCGDQPLGLSFRETSGTHHNRYPEHYGPNYGYDYNQQPNSLVPPPPPHRLDPPPPPPPVLPFVPRPDQSKLRQD